MKVREDTLKILVNNLSLRDYVYVTKDISDLEIEIERLNNIIKEAREYMRTHREPIFDNNCDKVMYWVRDNFSEEEIIKILDKGEDNE